MNESSDFSMFCLRCGRQLTPGEGNFYVVRIEAFADPTPPNVKLDDWPADPGAEIDRLIETMKGMSEQELMDQVHRRLTIHLCGTCYPSWIDNPAT